MKRLYFPAKLWTCIMSQCECTEWTHTDWEGDMLLIPPAVMTPCITIYCFLPVWQYEHAPHCPLPTNTCNLLNSWAVHSKNKLPAFPSSFSWDRQTVLSLFVLMSHSEPLEQTAISPWSLSPPSKWANPANKGPPLGINTAFVLPIWTWGFPPRSGRVFALSLFSQRSGAEWLWPLPNGKTTTQADKKDQNQSGSGSFWAVPEEQGNFLVALPRWLQAQPTAAAGSEGVRWGAGWVWRTNDGWDVG